MTEVNGTLDTVDGRPALRFERRLAHSAERVWRALTVPSELAAWFPGAADWTPAAGETFAAGGVSGEVTDLEVEHVLAWTFGDDRLRFELRSEGDGCVLTFTHVFGGGDSVAQTASGWDAYLDRLAPHLDGTPLPEEDAHDPSGERHEAYAARFGVDPEPGRRFIAGLAFRGLTLDADAPAVRLRRRYAHPPERLWQALTDPDELASWFPELAQFEPTETDAPRLLAGTWGDDQHLRFELAPDGDGCVLDFTHAFADRDGAAMFAAGWDRCFARVDALLAGVPMDEATALELWPDVHERYAAAFGVDPARGREAFAAHPAT